MKQKIAFFLLGALLSGLCLFGLQKDKSSSPANEEAHGEDQNQIKFKKAIKEKDEKIAQLEQTNRELSEEVRRLKEAQINSSSPASFPLANLQNASNAIASAVTKFTQAAFQHRRDAELAALKAKLKLNPEQEEQLRQLLERKTQAEQERLGRLFNRDSTAASNTTPFDFDSELKQILTSEQWTDYEKHQAEQRHLAAEASANRELTRLQSLLKLGSGQQDQVFQALYQFSMKNPQSDFFDGRGSEGNHSWTQRTQARKEALRSVLTSEQFEVYEKHLDSQQEFFRNVMRSFTPQQGSN